jgi:hypothetical protein
LPGTSGSAVETHAAAARFAAGILLASLHALGGAFDGLGSLSPTLASQRRAVPGFG